MTKTQLPMGATLLACVAMLSACAPMGARRRPDAAQLFASADANHDGVVTRDEFIAARAQKFASLDRDGDGFIDENDVPRRLRTRRNASDRVSELIAQFDTDGDGRISQSEFSAGPTLAFDRADTDHNGELSADELAAARAATANHHHPME